MHNEYIIIIFILIGNFAETTASWEEWWTYDGISGLLFLCSSLVFALSCSLTVAKSLYACMSMNSNRAERHVVFGRHIVLTRRLVQCNVFMLIIYRTCVCVCVLCGPKIATIPNNGTCTAREKTFSLS